MFSATLAESLEVKTGALSLTSVTVTFIVCGVSFAPSSAVTSTTYVVASNSKSGAVTNLSTPSTISKLPASAPSVIE